MIILRVLWQLPQTILGLIVGLFLKTKKLRSLIGEDNGVWIRYFSREKNSLFVGVSFGLVVYLPIHTNMNTIQHELGHSVQSSILGWLYLPLVGIPSLCRHIVWRVRKLPTADYYKGYPEKWADDLGGVVR